MGDQQDVTVKVQRGAGRSIFDCFATEGGHIVVCLVLVFVGLAAIRVGVDMHGGELVMFALGALGRSMMGSRGKVANGGGD